MTSEELMEFNKLYASQMNTTLETAAKVMEPWLHRFNQCTFSAVKDAFMALLMEESMPKENHQRMVALIKRVRKEVPREEESPDKNARAPDDSYSTWCNRCYDGIIYVPHLHNFVNGQWWKGEYDMVVRCVCSRGWKYGKMMNIDDYERQRPNWRDEVPIRKMDFRIKYTQARLQEVIGGNDRVAIEHWESRCVIAGREYDIYTEEQKKKARVDEPVPMFLQGELDEQQESQASESGSAHREADTQNENHKELAS